MNRRLRHQALMLAGAIAVAAVLPAAALAHAQVGPAVSLSGKQQLYSLAVPGEKARLTTTRVEMVAPKGFAIDSVVPPPPGWVQQVQQTGSGESAVVTRITWSGGHTSAGQDALFQFLAQTSDSRTYTFDVKQTYSDGSIVDWNGSEDSDAPAPTIQTRASLGGSSSSSLLLIITLVVAVLALAAALFALVSPGGPGRGGRALA